MNRTLLRGALCAALAWLAAPVARAAPASGRPAPGLAAFDTAMSNYVDTSGARSAVLGVMRNAQVVYLRGFGKLTTGGADLPETALFRVASLSKGPTAAAIRMMAGDGTFGPLGLDRKAFNLTVAGNNNGGLLSLTPFPSLASNNYANITIRHLLDQTSGFTGTDAIFRDASRTIATDMSLGRPPTHTERIRWRLGKPQGSTIGTFNYENFNYLVLGHIIDTLGGGYLNFIRTRVLTPEAWTPAADVQLGRTLEADRLAREASYPSSGNGTSVFDYSAPVSDQLPLAYGGEYDMDALLGAGSLVLSAPAMLRFASRFRLWYPNAGLPYTGNGDGAIHDGGLHGVGTRLTARGDGLVIFVATAGGNVGTAYDAVNAAITAGGLTWPTVSADGYWTTLPAGNAAAGFGGYHAPWEGFAATLGKSGPGGRLRLKAGTGNFTGRITGKLYLDAPLGSARLGVTP